MPATCAGNDTELLTHVEEAEEIAERDQDDGMKLEPFNLAQERQEGFFDESGHYVEHKPDDEDEKDAWLGSEDGEQHQPPFLHITGHCKVGIMRPKWLSCCKVSLLQESSLFYLCQQPSVFMLCCIMAGCNQ